MLIYKQRYKPRTSRVFTKSDLTVYDSAGNTALNALTVYGKSEVVDGSIKSAGEGWATVDLGTLTWTYRNNGVFSTEGPINYQYSANVKAICTKYSYIGTISGVIYMNDKPDKSIALYYQTDLNARVIYIKDTDYTDATAFQNSLNGVLLAYEEATTTNNTIAIKTDNGTGINGTMATFTTGTPLRGIPETGVRDSMYWDGSSGEVTKNCNKANASDLTWSWNASYEFWRSNSLINLIKPSSQNVLQSFIVTPLEYTGVSWQIFGSSDKTYSVSPNGTIGFKDSNYDNTKTPDFEFLYELATPTTEQLTTAENASIAGLRTFEPQTHAQNNAQTKMTVDYTIKVPTI